METLELKNTKIKIKNSLDGFNARFKRKEKRISKHEDRSHKMIRSKEEREERSKSNKWSLRHLWDNVNCSNIRTYKYIMGVQEGGKKK